MATKKAKLKRSIRRKPNKKRMVVAPRFVAVVINAMASSAKISGRPYGDWSCFIDDTKELAAARALKAINTWEAQRPDRKYRVIVGEITEAVQVPVKFELVAL